MAINLDNFVNVSIKYHLTGQNVSNRDTVVLFVNGTSDTEKLYESLSEYGKDYPAATSTTEPNKLYYYGYTYFKNGGLKLLVKTLKTSDRDITDLVNAENYASYVSDGLFYKDNNDFVKITSEPYSEGTEYYQVSQEYHLDTTVNDTNYSAKVAEGLYTKGGDTYTQITTEPFDENTDYYVLLTDADPLPFTKDDLIKAVKELNMEYIVIAATASDTVMNEVAKEINVETINEDGEETMIWRKKFIANINNAEDDLEAISTEIETLKTAEIGDGLILKYGEPGVEMSIGAYLSQINIDYTNSVQDYDYTTSNVVYEYTTNGEKKSIGKSYNDNELVTYLMKQNVNIDSMLVGAIRNLGGNQFNGRDLVNEYMLIVLNQTLTERLVSLLTKKIKYNSTGLSLIGAEISRELQRYLNNGYLTTDKSWTDEDLSYKGITIITKNTPLKTGFKYVVLPFSVLSSEELAEHKLPPIYILVADSYSIRKINVVGEVF